MPSKKINAEGKFRFRSLKSRVPLLGTLFWGFAIWFEYVSMKSSVELRMGAMERVSPEEWDLVYQWEINYWIEHHYFVGAVLVLWFVYLVCRWVGAFRVLRHR